MAPVDIQLPMATMQQGGAGTIPLATLIEYIVQRTYHELTVLAELLPRQSDRDRKIQIVQFASRTRQLFVRLLALVKWANSASKVDKCASISSFLDQQAMLFVDTADALARMARETLISARLPAFSLPCAIDVLTTGSYPRLPSCIKERIVPPDPITPTEKKETLHRLNQIIEYRLVTSDLPPQLRHLSIGNGRVKFTVSHEFEVTLTLMGDGPAIPWRLLNIEFLVEDHETGDGKSLVHSLQVNYIHQLIQGRLLDNDRPLHDLYNCLHSFCQSLQLEVMHTQTQRLMRERLGDHIWVEQYVAGKCLTISYWRNQNKKDKTDSNHIMYKLSVHVDDGDAGNPLQVSHTPDISGKERYQLTKAIRSDHLSIEKLLIQTIQVRSQSRLKLLLQDIKKYAAGPGEVSGVPSVLSLCILHPCMESEKLYIAVDIQRGTYLVSLQQFGTVCKITDEIQEALNEEKWGSISELKSKLRIWLALRRCEKSVSHLPTTVTSEIPLISPLGHPVHSLLPNKIYIKLNRQQHYYVVVEAFERKPKAISYKYNLLRTTPCTFQSDEACVSLDDIPCLYVKPKYLIHLNMFSLTHGPLSRIYNNSLDGKESRMSRKVLSSGPEPESPYYVPELAHIVASCEDRIPFIALGEELEKQGFKHQGVFVESAGACLSMTLLDLPPCHDCSQKMLVAMKKDLLTFKFRLQASRSPRYWTVEMVFANNLLRSTNIKEQGPLQRVFCMYEYVTDNTGAKRVVAEVLDDLSAVCRVHDAVKQFADIYNDPYNNMETYIQVKSFNFKKIVLGYGPNKNYNATISWLSKRSCFHISFGTESSSSGSNPHQYMASQLDVELGLGMSLAKLAQVLHETWSPMSCLAKLPTAPQLGLNKPNQPNSPFTILIQSSSHIRVSFRNFYCLDINFRGNKMVSIRDGAYSLFDTSKVVDGVNPTPGLKAFLNMFIDDSSNKTMAGRRRSTTEDDNPPSPVGIDPFEFMNQQPQMGSPVKHLINKDAQSAQQSYMSTASPASSAFPLTSPPSLQHNVGTPSPGMLGVSSPGSSALHVPSPGSFVPAPSPSSLGIHMPSPAGPFISPQGMVDGGSPYTTSGLTMPSPGQRNWPGSPSVPGQSPRGVASVMSPGHAALHSPPDTRLSGIMSPPSRMLPQRFWAASVPTLLSHDALQKLVTPVSQQGVFQPCSPLERFLGSTYMKRHLQRVVQSEERLQNLPPSEPGVVMFKSENLQCRVSANQTLQTLHLKVTKTPESKDNWSVDDLQVIEKYFESKVACPPYKPSILTAFGRLLSAPGRILRDCINILKLDMNMIPDRNHKWALQLCLMMPPGGPSITGVGTPTIVLKNNKMLMIFHLTRMNLPPGVEPQTIIVPIVHDIANNVSNYAEQRSAGVPPPSQASLAISAVLKRFSEMHTKNECSLFPSVREIVTNLVLPV